MVKIIFGCLFLALGLWGCDDGCQLRGVGPCAKPFKFAECLSETFLDPKACFPFCEVDEIDTVSLSPDTCEFVDCFTLECITNEGQNAVVDIEPFPTDGIVIISIDGGEPFESGCFTIDGDACV